MKKLNLINATLWLIITIVSLITYKPMPPVLYAMTTGLLSLNYIWCILYEKEKK